MTRAILGGPRSSTLAPAIGLLVASGLLVWFLQGPAGMRAVAGTARAPSPEPPPIVPDGPVPEEDLPIANNQPRGALRVTGPGATADLRLHAVLDFDQRPGVVAFEPGFVGTGSVEFYGLDAGQRPLYFTVGGRCSALLSPTIAPHKIVEVAMPTLQPQTTRRLIAEGLGTSPATLLLEFEGAELTYRWRGSPLELQSPLAQPRRIAVSIAEGAEPSRRLGIMVTPDAAAGDLLVRVPAGDRTVQLVGDDGTGTLRRYAITLCAGLSVTADAVLPTAKNLLAVLRPDEFAVPPRVHTWTTQPLDATATITGASSGEAWIGVGFERLARYVLWRRQAEAVPQVARVSPPHATAFTRQAALLPMWIRTMGRDDALAAGSRSEHDFGPGEAWEHGETAAQKWRRLAAFVDGNGNRRPLAANRVAIPAPPDMREGDELTLTVRVPHALRGDGAVYFLQHRGNEAIAWPPMPDGLVDGVLRRNGAVVAALHSAVVNGEFLGRATAWSDSDVVTDDWRQLDLRAVDTAGAGLAGVEVYGEDGKLVATTDAEGRGSIQRATPVRRPTFVSMRANGRFTTNAFTNAVRFDLVQREPTGAPLDWAKLQAVLGVELGDLSVDTVSLSQCPHGESMPMTKDARTVIAPTEAVVFAGGRSGAELWGWFDGETVANAPATTNPATATVVLVNYESNRGIHVSLPRTEIRLALDKGRMQSLKVHAPTRLSLTSIVFGKEGEQMLVDEGIAAELQAGDVLVATYKEK